MMMRYSITGIVKTNSQLAFITKKGEIFRPFYIVCFDFSNHYLAKLTARVSRITVIFTCPG